MKDLTLKRVTKRRKNLIRYNLWDMPSADVIEAWSQQFSDESDKHLAMVALDALMVRSQDSAKSSIWYMLSSILPKMINCDRILSINGGSIPYDILRCGEFANQINIQRLERPTTNPGSGQSSDDIIRDLRYKYSANSKYFDISMINVPNIILIDEFCGSGTQASSAIRDWQSQLSQATKISLFFMAIHETGYYSLRNDFPNINIYASEILGKESSLTTHISEAFNCRTITDSESILKSFTKNNFRKENGISPLGFHKMSLCFKPPYTACNNMAGIYLLKTKNTNVRLFERGF